MSVSNKQLYFSHISNLIASEMERNSSGEINNAQLSEFEIKWQTAKRAASIDLSTLTQESVEKYLLWKMEEKECYFAPSPISGKGLYVMQSVKKNGVIVEYTGRRMNMSVIEEEEKEQAGKYAHEEYMLESFYSTVVIDASGESAGIAKYANHKCNPNCEFVSLQLKNKEGGKVEVIFIKSKRKLLMFEEITAKYEWGADEENIRIGCNCGSENCVGYIGRLKKKDLMEKGRKVVKKSK